jgi:hypothetical protein
MKQIALTPVERGILFILMAQGAPLRQSDIKNIHGIEVKKHHRKKLQDEGLIAVEGTRTFTLSLAKKGWAWLEAELTAQKPRGSMGLGPLYAALGVIDKLVKKVGLSLQDALKPDDPRPTEWIEADEYIARALQDIPVFGRALTLLREAPNGSLGDAIERAELAAELVSQHVRLAGMKRALVLDGEVGAETAFDPVRFLSDDDVAFGDPVKIRKPPVTRMQGSTKILVQPGLADQIFYYQASKR